MMWFWTAYLSIGTYLLIPAIVSAWDMSKADDTFVKVLGSIIAIAIWPVIFFQGK